MKQRKGTTDNGLIILTQYLKELSCIRPYNGNRWIVGIAGVPCSGKSTLGCELKNMVNNMVGWDVCECIGMDGYHYERKYLDRMENPKLAHEKRGAHWTFDCMGFGMMLDRIYWDNRSDIIVPSFDHALKDPTPNGTVIMPHHKLGKYYMQMQYCII